MQPPTARGRCADANSHKSGTLGAFFFFGLPTLPVAVVAASVEHMGAGRPQPKAKAAPKQRARRKVELQDIAAHKQRKDIEKRAEAAACAASCADAKAQALKRAGSLDADDLSGLQEQAQLNELKIGRSVDRRASRRRLQYEATLTADDNTKPEKTARRPPAAPS